MRPGAVLATMLAACVQVSAIGAAVTAALPEIGRKLHASQDELNLVADVYVVMLGGLVLAMGALLDRFGRRAGMLAGLAVIVPCCVWSALAGSPAELIASRCATGIGSAALFPGTLATITSALPAEQRERNVALWAGCVFLGGGVGLILSGIVSQVAGLEEVFLVQAAITALIALATARWVPETRDPQEAYLDPLGAVLGFVGLGASVLAIIELPVRGWDGLVLVSLVLGLLALVAFVAWELRTPRPLIDLRVLSDRAFSSGAVAVAVSFGIGFGWLFLSFQYYQYVLGWSPLGASAGLIPAILATVPSSILAARLTERYGRRAVIVSGLVIQAVGLVMCAETGVGRDTAALLLGFFVFGVGTGIVQSPATDAIVSALPRSKQGVASAINDSARELGAALGIAVMGAMFNGAYRGHIADVVSAANGLKPTVRDSPAVGLAVAGDAHPVLVAKIQSAVASGWEAGLLLGAGGVLACAACLFAWCPGLRRAPAVVAEPAPRGELRRWQIACAVGGILALRLVTRARRGTRAA